MLRFSFAHCAFAIPNKDGTPRGKWHYELASASGESSSASEGFSASAASSPSASAALSAPSSPSASPSFSPPSSASVGAGLGAGGLNPGSVGKASSSPEAVNPTGFFPPFFFSGDFSLSSSDCPRRGTDPRGCWEYHSFLAFTASMAPDTAAVLAGGSRDRRAKDSRVSMACTIWSFLPFFSPFFFPPFFPFFLPPPVPHSCSSSSSRLWALRTIPSKSMEEWVAQGAGP
mmetsp:Transcript_15692/g.23059  ORF Transcript_15692/g.23059 Transcript_15692/m.23059 type:complete len:230 (-) Transcript_15692:1162-1851(-)